MDYLYFSIPCMIVIIGLELCRRFSSLSHKSQSIAWKILLIRLVLPFLKIPSPVSIYNWLSPGCEQPIVHIKYTAGETVIDPVSVAAIHSMDTFVVLLWIGLGLAVCVFLFIGFQCIRLIRNSIPCENIVGIEWAKTFPLDIKIRYSWKIRSPMSYGLFGNNYILLPEDFEFCEETKCILEHEGFHLKAHDTLWKVLSLLMVCIHWFNPVSWIFYMYIQAEMECLSDENVLNLHPLDYRSKYAKLLLAFSTGEKPQNVSAFSTFQNYKFLEKRISCIMKHKKPSTLQWCTASIACTLVVLCASTNSIAYASGWKISVPENFKILENSYHFPSVDFNGNILKVSIRERTVSHKVNPENMVVYDNNGLPWSFEQGQKVSLCVILKDRNFSKGQQIEFGFNCENSKETVFAAQVKAGFTISFTVPKTGDYYFYLINSSSDSILVKSFTLESQ